MNRLRLAHYFLAIAWSLLLCSHCLAAPQGRNPAAVDAAVEALSNAKSQEALNEAVMTLYRQFGNRDLTPLLLAIWNGEKRKYPGLPWQLLSEPEFRLQFASLLAQWLRETRTHQEMIGSIKDYVLRYRDSNSLRLRAAAINFTADPDSCDVEALLKIAHEGNVYAAMAVGSLTKIMGPEAKPILLTLRAEMTNDEVRGAIDRQLASLGSHAYPDARYFRINPRCPMPK